GVRPWAGKVLLFNLANVLPIRYEISSYAIPALQLTPMDTKTEMANTRSRSGTGSSRQFPEMKRSHWIIFIAICLILGLLVFATIIHVINTTPSRARLLHAAVPVETVPVRNQDLKEIIGGSGSIEQGETVQLTSQVTAQVLQVPVKVGDLVKKGDLLVNCDDRLIQATLQANRDYVEV